MIAVFGAGAIGCWVGGRLAAGGAKVTLIGRARVMDELAGGVTTTELDGPPHTVKVTATTDPAAAAGAQVTLVTVKSAQTAEAGATLAKVLPEGATVLSLQNGVRNADVLRAALPGRRVLACMVPWNVVRKDRGSYHRGTTGVLMVEAAPEAAVFVEAARAANIVVEERRDITAVQWTKLVMNLNNAINALAGVPLKTELAERDYRRVLAAAMREAMAACAKAKQPLARLAPIPPGWVPRVLELPDGLFNVIARRMLAVDPHARSSMWDDLEAKRPTEVDYLQGEVLALAERVGTPAPVNAALLRLVRAAEAGGRRDYSGAELRALTESPGS
ncbi:MAG: 2-dehydropantoate 2-reductase [Deltaproteobacteria bacterium]|nr:2-dehydropantoate 2-reductase [Deltaproteobacteria bacterium]